MLARYGIAAVVLSTAMLLAAGAPVRAQQKAAGPQTVAEANEQYPQAYVCKDIQQTQIDDKPGICNADKTPLVPIRLGTAYKCLRGPANYSVEPTGPCATPQPKGAVTVSVYWTCKAQPSQRYLDPGKCGDGTAREIAFEERPHGDHNPRHGGLAIFMSPDLYYHVEGTYSPNGVFRAYFYNEFTKPLKVTGLTGRVALANSNNVATGPEIPLTPAPIADGNALEAKIPNAPVPSKSANVFFKLYIKLKPNAPDWVTDHQFPDYSKDPAPPAPAGAVTTGAARGTQNGTIARGTPAAGAPPRPAATPNSAARTSPPAAAPKPSAAAPVAAPRAAPAAPPPAAPPATAAASAPAAPSAQEASSQAGSSNTVMAGGADVSAGPNGPQVTLPQTTPELLTFLKDNAANVKQLLDQGQLGGMWYPALAAKDAGLALDADHHEGLNDAQHAKLASAVKQLTVVAWQIDAAGDLGNRTQLDQLTSDFESLVTDILALYAR